MILDSNLGAGARTLATGASGSTISVLLSIIGGCALTTSASSGRKEKSSLAKGFVGAVCLAGEESVTLLRV